MPTRHPRTTNPCSGRTKPSLAGQNLCHYGPSTISYCQNTASIIVLQHENAPSPANSKGGSSGGGNVKNAAFRALMTQRDRAAALRSSSDRLHARGDRAGSEALEKQAAKASAAAKRIAKTHFPGQSLSQIKAGGHSELPQGRKRR